MKDVLITSTTAGMILGTAAFIKVAGTESKLEVFTGNVYRILLTSSKVVGANSVSGDDTVLDCTTIGFAVVILSRSALRVAIFLSKHLAKVFGSALGAMLEGSTVVLCDPVSFEKVLKSFFCEVCSLLVKNGRLETSIR
jgi:hypothetical protein